MDLKGTLEKMKYDKRLVQMNIRKRVVKESEYNQYLKDLEDLSHQLEPLKEAEEKSSEPSSQSESSSQGEKDSLNQQQKETGQKETE